MDTTTQLSPQQGAMRIGILLDHSKELNLPALRFLIVRMNSLQSSFEFEILPSNPQDRLFQMLSGDSPAERADVRAEAPLFLDRYRRYLLDRNEGYDIRESPPEHFVIVTMARFSDNFYSLLESNLGVLALGDWKRSMAPPSIVEFILTLILRQSVAFACPPLESSMHLGTKGCLCDFNPYLGDVRLKVLQGFICDYCRRVIQAEGFPRMPDELTFVLNKEWLGKSTDPACPAGIAANLGHDLFVNKGLKPTVRESFLATIQQEGVKQLLTIIGTILLAILVLWLGLQLP